MQNNVSMSTPAPVAKSGMMPPSPVRETVREPGSAGALSPSRCDDMFANIPMSAMSEAPTPVTWPASFGDESFTSRGWAFGAFGEHLFLEWF